MTRTATTVVVLALVAACSGAGRSNRERVVIALPTSNLIMIATYVADDLGIFRQHGLDVTIRTITGVAAVNAVIAGSADFTVGTGSTFMRAAARGQPVLALANLVDRPLVELVLRREVAQRLGFHGGMTLAERGRLLRALTIGVQGIGTIAHTWPRYVAGVGGLDPEQDLRITPVEPSSMLDGLRDGILDGYATSPPFTTQAIQSGAAVMLASGLTDAPELVPFGYGFVYGTREGCRNRPARCAAIARAYAAAVQTIRGEPDRVFTRVVQPRFAGMALPVLRAAWERTRAAHTGDVRVTAALFESPAKLNRVAKMLDPSASLTDFHRLHTNEYLDDRR